MKMAGGIFVNGETFFKANENDLQEKFEKRNDSIAILALKFSDFREMIFFQEFQFVIQIAF